MTDEDEYDHPIIPDMKCSRKGFTDPDTGEEKKCLPAHKLDPDYETEADRLDNLRDDFTSEISDMKRRHREERMELEKKEPSSRMREFAMSRMFPERHVVEHRESAPGRRDARKSWYGEL